MPRACRRSLWLKQPFKAAVLLKKEKVHAKVVLRARLELSLPELSFHPAALAKNHQAA